MQRIEDGYREPGYDGLRPEESLAVLTAEIHSFVAAQYSCWNDHLLPELRKQGIRLLEWDELSRGHSRVCPQLLSARGRSAADADHDRSGASVSARAEQGALPGAAAAGQAPQLRPAGAGRGDGAARAAALCAAARGRWPLRLHAAAGPDRAASGRHVSRLRGACFSLVPRDPQLQSVFRGGRGAVAA